LSEFLLYGLDAGGDPIFSETFFAQDRRALADIARQRLRRCHSVEIWEGPLCVLRLANPDN
jgi:hypothetical protein